MARISLASSTLLRVGLAVVVVVLSVVVLGLAVGNLMTTVFHGDFRYGCSNLQSRSTFNDSLVRWVALTCPSGPALELIPSRFSCGAHENSCTEIFPTFVPPPGLLGLFLFDHGSQNCPNLSYPSQATSPLISGERILVFSPAPGMDYCAVVNGSAGVLEGFNVEWAPGFGSRSTARVLLSATDAVTAIGENATVTVQASNQLSFDVTLAFRIGFVLPNTTFREIAFRPESLLVRAGGSNSTLVVFATSPGQTAGTYEVEITATPVYRLRFYGDYARTPGYYGAYAYPRVTIA